MSYGPDANMPLNPTWVRWRIVALLMAMSFLNHFNRISMSVAGIRIIDEYAIDPVAMGSVYSALLIAYTTCMTPGGWLSDRWGGWAALCIVGFGSAAFVALTGWVGQVAATAGLLLAALYVIRLALGAVIAPIYPASGRIVNHWVPFRRLALANALVTGAAPLGVAGAYELFNRLCDQYTWPVAFYIMGALTGVVAAVWAWYGRNDPAEHPSVNEAERKLIAAGTSGGVRAPAGEVAMGETPPPHPGVWRDILGNRSLWLITVSYATMGYVEYLVFYWSEYYFKTVLKFGPETSRVAAMIPPLTMAVCMPLGGWLSDRLMGVVGYRRARAGVAIVGMVGCAALLSAGTLTEDPVGIVICFALALGAVGLSEAPVWATAIDVGGKRASGTSSAIANTGGNAGGFLSPVVTPWVGELLTPELGEKAGWAWGLRLGSLICLSGAVLWLWIDASERVPSDR
jgi:ACS family glucarate transporter-like MFS transporter